MPEVTVKQYAEVIQIPVERLLEQLQEAGLSAKSEDDRISDNEKTELLGYLRRKHGKDNQSGPERITLRRKTMSEIKMPATGVGSRSKVRSKTVSVEVRKRRTYIKRGVIEEEQALFAIAVANKERDLSTSALRGFSTFIDQYPNSPLVPAAYLHRGELLTLDDKLDEAIADYLEIPRMFPTSDLIPRALYRAGVLCVELEYYDRAREYLERVINTYPDDRFAEQAREKLDEIP